MKKKYKIITISILGLILTGCQMTSSSKPDPTLLSEFKVGDKVQTLTNIHYHINSKKISTINYQFSSFIPVCSNLTINDITNKKIALSDENGIEYNLIWSGHSRKAGQTLADNFLLHFGESCDKKSFNELGEDDLYGIEQGIAIKGMTKKGVIFSMGYPPIHANTNKNSDYWLYWKSTYDKVGIEFNREDLVRNIKN